MKNKILVVISALVILISINSVAQGRIDMEVSGFWGVPFKSTKEEVKKLMTEKKDCVFGAFDNRTNSLVYSGGNFVGNKVNCSGLQFYNDCFYLGTLLIDSNSQDAVIQNYNNLKNELTAKYGLPTKVVENYKFPFEIDDGHQIEAIMLGKADLKTFWVFTHAMIYILIDSSLKINVAYIDGRTKDIVDNVEKKQNSKDL